MVKTLEQKVENRMLIKIKHWTLKNNNNSNLYHGHMKSKLEFCYNKYFCLNIFSCSSIKVALNVRKSTMSLSFKGPSHSTWVNFENESIYIFNFEPRSS